MRLDVENNKIILARTADNHPWPYYAARGKAYYGSLNARIASDNMTTNKFKMAGYNLKALASIEREKEIALLEKAGIDTKFLDEKNFFREFNELRKGKSQYEAALERFREAAKNFEADKEAGNIGTKSGKNKKDKKLAPTVSVFYASKLQTVLSEKIISYIKANYVPLSSGDYSSWDREYNAMVDESIREAFEKLLTTMNMKKGDEQYGNQKAWTEVFNAVKKLEGFHSMFRDIIKSKIKFSNLRIENLLANIKYSQEKMGVSTFLGSQKGLKLEAGNRTTSFAGSVEEAVLTAITQVGINNITGVITTAGTRVNMREMAKIDDITIYSYNKNISTTDAIDQLFDQMHKDTGGARSLSEMAKKYEDFYNSTLSKLDDIFIVYGNAKTYVPSSSSRGFSGGGARSLSEAPGIIAAAGGDGGAAENVVKAAYQTGAGAFLAGQNGPSESLKAALMGAVANLLFDDWVTIGAQATSGATAIHVLQVEGVEIPMSTFLRSAGEAMIQAGSSTEWIDVKVNVAGPDPEKLPGTIKTIDEIYKAWNENFSAVEAGSNFTYRFMINFMEKISQLI